MEIKNKDGNKIKSNKILILILILIVIKLRKKEKEKSNNLLKNKK